MLVVVVVVPVVVVAAEIVLVLNSKPESNDKVILLSLGLVLAAVSSAPALATHTEITLVAEWRHFTLFGIIFPTIKLKVYTFGGL